MNIVAKRAISIGFLVGGVVFSFIIINKKSDSNTGGIFTGDPSTSGSLFALLNTQNDATTFENTNLTEQAATQIAAQIIEEGATMDGDARALAADAISTDKIAERLQSAMQQGFQYEKITEKDIQVAYDNSTDKKIEYINSVGNTLSNIKLQKCGSENIFMLSAIALKEFADEKRERISCFAAEAEEKILNTLLATPVPSEYKDFHLTLVNSWKEKILAFKSLQKEDDPLKAYIATQAIQKNILRDKELFSDLVQKFKDLAS